MTWPGACPPGSASQFWVAIKEISTTPSSEVLAKWLDDPAIGPLVAELWKSMQANNMRM